MSGGRLPRIRNSPMTTCACTLGIAVSALRSQGEHLWKKVYSLAHTTQEEIRWDASRRAFLRHVRRISRADLDLAISTLARGDTHLQTVCRRCRAEFESPNQLRDHYVWQHAAGPDAGDADEPTAAAIASVKAATPSTWLRLTPGGGPTEVTMEVVDRLRPLVRPLDSAPWDWHHAGGRHRGGERQTAPSPPLVGLPPGFTSLVHWGLELRYDSGCDCSGKYGGKYSRCGCGRGDAGPEWIGDDADSERSSRILSKSLYIGSPDQLFWFRHDVAPLEPTIAASLTEWSRASWLTLAVLLGQTEAVGTLLSRGADPNGDGNQHRSALAVACVGGNTALVKLLLDHGADTRTVPAYGHTPVQAAVLSGNVEVLQMVLRAGCSATRMARTPCGELDGQASTGDPRHTRLRRTSSTPPLVLAAGRNSPAMVALLLRHGVHPNQRGSRGSFALLSACGAGSLEMVRLLLSAGATPTVVNAAGTCPVSSMGGRQVYATPMLAALSHPDPAVRMQIAALLLANGANANAPIGTVGYKQNRTLQLRHPTALAAALLGWSEMGIRGVQSGGGCGGDVELVKLLLRHGADPAMPDHCGNVPAAHALFFFKRNPAVCTVVLDSALRRGTLHAGFWASAIETLSTRHLFYDRFRVDLDEPGSRVLWRGHPPHADSMLQADGWFTRPRVADFDPGELLLLRCCWCRDARRLQVCLNDSRPWLDGANFPEPSRWMVNQLVDMLSLGVDRARDIVLQVKEATWMRRRGFGAGRRSARQWFRMITFLQNTRSPGISDGSFYDRLEDRTSRDNRFLSSSIDAKFKTRRVVRRRPRLGVGGDGDGSGGGAPPSSKQKGEPNRLAQRQQRSANAARVHKRGKLDGADFVLDRT